MKFVIWFAGGLDSLVDLVTGFFSGGLDFSGEFCDIYIVF